MFSRRRRSQSLGRPATPASASAHTAATQAFLASQNANSNLSNSAAAAALRSMTPTPQPVGNIQTKRMLQRHGSVSSNASAPAGRPDLQRRGSSGSMTERTFRTPSPNRPGSSGGPGSRDAAPPVPPVPQIYDQGKQHRRAASMEPPPARMLSPPPKKQGGRGVSVDRGAGPTPRQRPKSSVPALGNISEMERPGSRNSINFSRPMSPVSTRGSPQSALKNVTLSNNSPTPQRNGLAASEASNIQQTVADAANAPVKKKKKKVAAPIAEGSHLAAGGMGGKPLGTAVSSATQENVHVPVREPVAAAPAPAPESATQLAPPPKKKKKKVTMSTPPDSDSEVSDAGSLDKRAQRASGILNKQPSVVREDWEGEQAASTQRENISPASSPLMQPQGRKEAYAPNTTRQLDDAKNNTLPPPTLITTIPTPELSTDQFSPQFLEPQNNAQRLPSVSPSRSRSARFSAHLASELSPEGRHEPPPRSVSPAKSALKHHSPSSVSRSPVDRGPGEWRLSSLTPSEASDTQSLASTDGIAGPRKMKSARVSFDNEPEVGTAASIPASDGSAGKALETIPADDGMEEVFQPRPALPSFGSIRGKKNGSNKAPLSAAAYEPPSSQSSASSSPSNMPTTMDTSISSDHAIAGIIAQGLAKQATPAPVDHNAPLPPEVTTVEGNGYVSDTDSSVYSEDGHPEGIASTAASIAQPDVAPSTSVTTFPPRELSPVQELPEVKAPVQDLQTSIYEAAPTEPVPTIAIQPATPGRDGGDRWLVSIPGTFPDAFEEPEARETPATAVHEGNEHVPVEREVAASSPADLGISEPMPPEAAMAHDPSVPPVGGLYDYLRQQSLLHDSGSDSDGNSSIYSDAAEDQADLEGDGFGSINAIVDSPMVPSPLQRIVTPPESPLAPRSRQEPTEGWNQAQERWSNIAQRQRENVNQVGRIDPAPVMAEPPKTKPRKKKAAMPAATVAGNLAAPSKQQTTAATGATQVQQGASMRKSMRSQPEVAASGPTMRGPAKTTGMKSSMRSRDGDDDATGPTMRGPGRTMGMKSSMRNAPAQAAPPPASAPAPAPTKGALQKRNIPAAIPPPTTSSKPVQRTFSNDSDSESSFRKQRRAKSAGNTMRRSMRAAPEQRPQSPVAPVGRGVRSMSPPQNRKQFQPGGRGVSVGGRGTMRTSMRDSVDEGTPTLRDQRRGSASGFSGFRGKQSTMTAPAPSPTVASRFKSRFVNDSDDESPTVSKHLGSRFEDSSDDEPEPLRPVRGIPQTLHEGDSTDLSDSSDEGKGRRGKVQIASDKDIEAQTRSPNPAVRRRSSGSGRDLTKSIDPTASPSSQKKGLFSRFRSKKVKDDSRVQKNVSESPARRDTHLERTRAELERARSPTPATPSPGKLQRRHTPSRRVTSDSWPLPPKVTADTPRPNTADGLLNKETYNKEVDGVRPPMHERQETSNTIRTDGGTPVYGRSGKKKKFPMLRKAFGLSD